MADHPSSELQDSSISFAVHSLEGLKKFPKKSSLHVNIDSGMHRNGIQEDEIQEAFKIIMQNNLNLKGMFTHFRSADELSSELYWQNENFNRAKAKAKELIFKV